MPVDHEGPACGTQACGNDQRDTCTVARREYEESWAAEACDGAQLGGATCGLLGYAGGELGCNADCGWDLSGCEVCPPGRCSRLAGPQIEWTRRAIVAASNGQRVRLAWSTWEPRDDLMHHCLYTAWAEEGAAVVELGCNLTAIPHEIVQLEPRDDGTFDVAVAWAGRRWRAPLSDAGELAAEGLEEEFPTPQRLDCSAIGTGPMEFRLLHPTPADNDGYMEPLRGQWFRADEPQGDPVRVGSDPAAARCIHGAVVGDELTVVWVSPGRGLMMTRVPVPATP